MLSPLPEGRIPLTDRRLGGGLVMMAIAAVIGVAFLPRALVNADEYYYAGQARVFLHGRATPVEGDPLPVPFASPADAVRYPPGWPLVLALGRAVSFRAMFVVGLLAHLAGGLAVARLLVRRGAPSWLNAVYLFHPTFWAFSRTLMSDVPATAAFLVAMDAWENRRAWVSGLAVAAGCVTRLGSVVAATGFMLVLLSKRGHRRKDCVVVACCAVAGMAALLAWNRFVTGAWWNHYAANNRELLSGRTVLGNALLYGAGLIVLPPFSGAWLLLRPARADRWAIAAVPIMAFFLAYAYHDASSSAVLTLVGGQRLVVVAHAILLVATAGTWASLAPFRSRALLATVGIGVAVLGAVLVRRMEAPHRAAAEVAQSCRPARVAYNMNAIRAAAAVDADAYRVLDGRDRLPPADLVVLARSSPSRRPGSGAMHYVGVEPAGTHCVAVGPYRIHDLSGACRLRGDPCESER